MSSECGHKDFDWQADLRIFAQSSFGELFNQLHSPFCTKYHKTWHTCLHDICPTLAICLAINFLLCTHPTYTHHHHQAGRGGQGAKPKPDSWKWVKLSSTSVSTLSRNTIFFYTSFYCQLSAVSFESLFLRHNMTDKLLKSRHVKTSRPTSHIKAQWRRVRQIVPSVANPGWRPRPGTSSRI